MGLRIMKSMNHLLLAMFLFAALPAWAGVTIHFEGEAKNDKAIDAIITEATAFAAKRGWRVESASKAKGELERVKDDKSVKYVGPIRGIILYPHAMCEPVYLQFGSDHAMQDFVKTQFAGADVHIAVIELLRLLKPKFSRLKVEDEGEYWETGNRSKLEQHISTVNRMIKDIIREKPSARGPVKLKDGRMVDIIQ